MTMTMTMIMIMIMIMIIDKTTKLCFDRTHSHLQLIDVKRVGSWSLTLCFILFNQLKMTVVSVETCLSKLKSCHWIFFKFLTCLLLPRPFGITINNNVNSSHKYKTYLCRMIISVIKTAICTLFLFILCLHQVLSCNYISS